MISFEKDFITCLLRSENDVVEETGMGHLFDVACFKRSGILVRLFYTFRLRLHV
jgi:hypothetical protein